jgi:hypothetical protein
MFFFFDCLRIIILTVMSSIASIWKSTFVNSWFFKRYSSISTFRSFISFKDITISRIRDFISSSINVIMFRIRDFIFCSSFKYKFFLFLNRKSVRNSKQINIVFEYQILLFNNERRQNLLQNHHVDFQFEQFSSLNRRA